MEKILFVAPEQKELTEYTLYLQSEGFSLDFESDERIALKKTEKELYRGILFYYKKNWYQGLSACERIKKETRIPVFMVSEYQNEIEAACAIRKGIYYFPSGVTPLYISAAMKMIVANHDIKQETALRKIKAPMDVDLQIQKEKKKIILHGKEIECTGKPYEVLLYLVSQNGRYCTEEELYEKVWNMDTAYGYKDSVRVAIRSLRKKLEQENRERVFIENARGRGYRFCGKGRIE